MEVAENKKIYVLICKTITLKPLYVGQLCDKSKMRRVPEKAAKHQLKTAQVLTETKLNEQKQTEKKQVLTYCAINFAKFEDLEQFE